MKLKIEKKNEYLISSNITHTDDFDFTSRVKKTIRMNRIVEKKKNLLQFHYIRIE